MNLHRLSIYVFIFIFLALSLNCSTPKKGYLEVSYELYEITEIDPSYQIAVWLEDENHAYVRSLFVSEYLSYGGYNLKEICSDWNKKVDWDNVSEEEYDAVTAATPEFGSNTHTLNCTQYNIPPGIYHYYVEVHIVDDANVMYSGTIKIGSGPTQSQAIQSIVREKHPVADNIIKHVKARYYEM